jgi:uncharacterized membrane protein YqhA
MGFKQISYRSISSSVLTFCLEQWIGKSKWYFFPLSIALIAIHQPFYLYLYGVLILIYALVRHFEDASKPVSQLLYNCSV